MIDLIFLVSLLFLSYTYFIYPIIVFLLSKYCPCDTDSKSETPKELPDVTVMLCVYNGQQLIENRINNILQLDYPKDKLNIIVVADGCNDETCQRVEDLALKNVKLLSYDLNRGKSYALSVGLQHVQSDLVLFADLRQTYDRDVLKYLVPHFNDDKVGAVTGNLLIEKSKGDPGLYWKYEKAIRKYESKYKSILGVTGAIYMARKSLMPNFPPNVVLDDMYAPLTMIKSGYRIIFCEQACAYDQGSHTLQEEFDRKVRTLAGNYQLFQLLPWTLNPIKNPVYFELISHKVCRLLVPYFLIFLFLTSFFVDNWFGQLTFWSQLTFYTIAAFYYFYLYKKHNKTNFILSFVMLNLAALKASVVYWLSPTKHLWKSH